MNPSRTSVAPKPDASSGIPSMIGERYRVRSLLGRGGMAAVYRVVDANGGPDLALKQLQLSEQQRDRAAIESLFEREFQTLAELDHPRVIRVYDYGVEPAGAYYTMELLDGASLTECAPLPWGVACGLMHDVCSSLSLLHVRRLLHRDVSPHNVRRTADGRGKLIDFGAMASMGPSEQVIGTPAFTAPEVAHRLSLDARTDLFSLGATLYFALTGTLAYAARSFAQLNDAWSKQPAPLSALVPDIPRQLDTLVMSMLSLEPALRPRSASEVMLQLATLIGAADTEHAGVSQAYVNRPSLVGREDLLERFGRHIVGARTRDGSSVLIEGGPGMGCSRALDACALLAQTRGCIVTRARGGSSIDARPFAIAERLTEQLALELPTSCLEIARKAGIAELLFDVAADGSLRTRTFSANPADRTALQDALTAFWFELARERVLMIAVDDIDKADEPSAAWLATLVTQLKKRPLLLAFSSPPLTNDLSPALKLIAQRSSRQTLTPLSEPQTDALLLSAFGDVPRVSLVADRVFNVARGNPRATMDLARHLIDRGIISYQGGTWSMPVQLSVNDLPETIDDAFATRAAKLSASARHLAELHALSTFGPLSKQDQALLMQVDETEIERDRTQLLEAGVLVQQGDLFAIANERWADALAKVLDETQRAARHRALGELGVQTRRPEFASAFHLFSAGAAARALDVLAQRLRAEFERVETVTKAAAARDGQVLCWALEHAVTLARPARELADLRRWLNAISVAGDDAYYTRSAPELLAVLRRDSGLQDWLELSEIADPTARVVAALTRANERHLALPEAERVYGVQDAIKYLVQFVVISIAIGTRTADRNILSSLPELLEPFVPLSPVLDAMHQNALATRECAIEGRYTQARARWQAVYDRLGNVPRDNLQYVDAIRSAIVFGLGTLEVARGLPAAAERATLLADDPVHAVNALYLRRVMRLQLGDIEGAERFRRQAELLALRTNARQMFNSMPLVELLAYVTARDLTGVREITERMAELGQHAAGWILYQNISSGCLQFVRGDLAGARTTFEAVLQQCWPSDDDPLRPLGPMPVAASLYLEVLIAQQAYAEARDFGRRALEVCSRADIHAADDIERSLALAEAALGDVAGGAARLDAVIARQRSEGVAGLLLGTMYEARARVAIWSGDKAALEENSKLTALEYRHGRSSPLGARYEQLMREARKAGIPIVAARSEFETTVLGTTTSASAASAQALIEFAVRSATSGADRVGAIARVLAEAGDASAAHLFVIHRDGSLDWAASYPEPPANSIELDLARQCLTSALDDDFGSTMAEPANDTGTDLWTERREPLRAMLLTTSGDARHVAVVVFASSPARSQHDPIFGVVAGYLLKVGATEGMSAMRHPSLDD